MRIYFAEVRFHHPLFAFTSLHLRITPVFFFQRREVVGRLKARGKRGKVERDERTSWELLERIIQTAVWNRWSLLPPHGHMASRYDAFVGSTASPGATHRRRTSVS